MRKGFKIGQIFGISIQVDWSWLVIFVLTVWNLSAVFGNFHPDWGAALRWGIAITAAFLFFASVLVHELAHTLVARARGVPVESITLFMFGGVSNIQQEPNSPGGEFLMAILGPVASLVIGGALLITTIAVTGLTQMAMDQPAEALRNLGPLATMFLWLGSINIILGIFNLIPGFPLDGGRVVRSIFWAITDDLRQATHWASILGQGIAWLMILSGIAMTFGVRIPFFGEGVADGLWLAFIGWFLQNAASQSYRRIVIEDILEDVTVSRMMQTNPMTVSPDITIEQLVEDHIMRSDAHAFPVMEAGQLAGIVCLEDVRAVDRERRSQVSVRDIMTPAAEVVSVSPDEGADVALHKLGQRDVRQLPVLSGEELVGLLRRQDIVKWLKMQSDLNTGLMTVGAKS